MRPRLLTGPPPAVPPDVDREFLEFARRRNPEAMSRIEKSPACRELLKAGCGASAVAFFYLDCAAAR